MSQSGTYGSGGGGAGTVQFLQGNTGGAIGPDGGGIIYVPGAHGLNSDGAGNTVTFAIDNAITLGDLAAIAAGSNALTVQTGDIEVGTGATTGNIKIADSDGTGDIGIYLIGGNRFLHKTGVENTFGGNLAGTYSVAGASNTAFGHLALSSITTGSGNTAIGSFAAQNLTIANFGVYIGLLAGNSLTAGGSESVAVGYKALQSQNAASDSVAVGTQALRDAVQPTDSTAVGVRALIRCPNGAHNTVFGADAGSFYTTNESYNLLIRHGGVAGESNVMRIGSPGEQLTCYIAGIDGVNVGSVAKVLTMASDQLGTATITAGTGISVTPGANTITIAATGGVTTLDYVSVNSSPYVVAATDDFIGVDCSGGAITVQLPDAPTTGRVIYIKDSTGSANTFNITVTTVGGAVNIDGATSYTMNTQYAAIGVIFSGSAYEIF